MKIIFILALVALSKLYASTIDSHSIPLYNLESEENFSLQTTQTRTAYRQESVARTCFRTEFDGYRNICEYFPEVACYETRNSARVCNTTLVYRCRQEPQYRTVGYTCYQTISVPYEVVDHQVQANFQIKINKKPKEPTDPTGSSCFATFTMEGDKLVSKADCPSLIVLSKEIKNTTNDRFGNLTHNYKIDLNLFDTQTVLAPLEGGITEMHLEGQNLTFKTGDLSLNSNFTLRLFVEKRHLFKNDDILIDRPLTKSEYSFEKINDQSGIVKINLEKLIGGVNTKKKHVFKVNIDVQLESGNILNSTFPNLNTNNSITVND